MQSESATGANSQALALAYARHILASSDYCVTVVRYANRLSSCISPGLLKQILHGLWERYPTVHFPAVAKQVIST
jgi:hypothetical protein